MPMSRPSLAFAGSAAVLVVAGIISHQVLVTPHLLPADIEGLAGESPARSVDEYLAAAPPGPAALVEAEQALADGIDHRPDSSRREEALGKQIITAQDDARMRGAEVRESMREASSQAHDKDLSENLRNYPQAIMVEPAHSVSPSSLPEARPSGHFEQGRDRFSEFAPNPVKVVAEEPVSTFSIDVDTASYAFIRASLNGGHMPDQDAVRTEELINYFPYDYAPPRSRDTPFATHVSLMPAPWNDSTRLLHIGIKGYELDRGAAPRANLVFLIDTSGSMDEPDKLPLLITSLKLLLSTLTPEDRVAIVAYAGSAGVVLPPTPVSDRAGILAGLERLEAGGSTAGAEGIRQAYLLAEQHMAEDGVNRVILATDGDFNVGITDPEELEDYIAHKRSSGVFLSVLGFGMGNYNDELMQRLAQSGNGNAAYIDTLSEARKVLVEEATSTLFPIAKDVKIQVEFNRAMVSEYRLIGFETRMLAREDFRDDKVDAGEIGAGHTVTAVYEVTPAGSGAERVPTLRYQDEGAAPKAEFDGEVAFVKIRYKLTDAETSTLIARPVPAAGAFESVGAAPRDVRFSAAVAAFGQLLRGGRYTGDFGYDDVIALAQGARGDDPFGYRNEFIGLVRLAQSLGPLSR